MKHWKAAAAAAVLAMVAGAGQADALVFAFTIGGGATGSGSITTQDTANGAGGYLVTRITGTYNSNPISGLIDVGTYPTPAQSLFPNDNLLFANNAQLLSVNGLSFTSSAEAVNIYGQNSGYELYRQGSPGLRVTFTIVQTAGPAAVPEPASWAVLLVGFAAVGAVARRRRTTVAYA